MTTAVCKACEELKFGAWLPCAQCGRVTNSLWLSDHFLSQEGLDVASERIKRGQSVTIRRCWRYVTAKAWLPALLPAFLLAVLKLGALGLNNDDIPASFDLHTTYLDVERGRRSDVVPFSDASECARAGSLLGGKCITGAEAKQRFGSK